ncbi:hypothetical protein O3I_009625 [Nocardia brasiliensis ATCC 700358]|uniref:Uncharacterized protein n=1 Tax=Nocardia brasiliensis (strain ATCC 700358 / HUJEG-1) TaxID=1133849 RepID=K0EWC5_NOCB7|nr:hypothetical protein O3I_009625 [Nocardia brasiliensis ATCC 700358]
MVGECGSCRGTRYFARDTRGRLGCRGHGGAAEPTGRDIGRTGEQPPVAEAGTHRTARGTCGRRHTGVLHILHGDLVAVADADLQNFGTDLQSTLFDGFEDGAVQRGASGGLGGGTGEHSSDQLLDRHANGDLGGHSQSDRARSTDPGPGGGQQWGHLDREDDHRADDDEFGLLDIGCAVADLIGERVEIFDQARPSAFLTGQLVPVRRDGLVGLAIDGCQRLPDRMCGLVVDFVECRRHRRPRVGHAPHRGLIALRPITRTDNPFGDPLQGFRDLDAHQGLFWFSWAALI